MRLLVSLRAVFAGFPWERTIPDYPVKLPRDPVRLRATPRGGEHTGRGESQHDYHTCLHEFKQKFLYLIGVNTIEIQTSERLSVKLLRM